jgi:hypothetical protein
MMMMMKQWIINTSDEWNVFLFGQQKATSQQSTTNVTESRKNTPRIP